MKHARLCDPLFNSPAHNIEFHQGMKAYKQTCGSEGGTFVADPLLLRHAALMSVRSEKSGQMPITEKPMSKV